MPVETVAGIGRLGVAVPGHIVLRFVVRLDIARLDRNHLDLRTRRLGPRIGIHPPALLPGSRIGLALIRGLVRRLALVGRMERAGYRMQVVCCVGLISDDAESRPCFVASSACGALNVSVLSMHGHQH